MTTRIEKTKTSLRSSILRLMIVLQLFTAIIVLAIIFFIFQFIVLASSANTCRISLETVALKIDANRILEYAQTGQKKEGYEDLYDYMSDVQSINNLNSLYILVEDGDQYEYIIESRKERDKSTVINSLGDRRDKSEFRPEIQRCFDEGKSFTYGANNYSLNYEDAIMAVAPIKDMRGNVVAVLYGDILKGTILENQKANLFSMLPSVAGMLLITCSFVVLLLTLFARSIIVNPLSEVTKLSARLSEGEIDVEIPQELLWRDDEIGLLSRSFAKMAGSMSILTGELEPMIESALKEDFSKRADKAKVKGIYNSVLENLNMLMDVVVNKVLFYETLLDSVPMPVSAITKDKTWFYMNKSAIENFVVDGHDPRGKACSQMGWSLCKGMKCMIETLEEEGLDHVVLSDFVINERIYRMHAARVLDKNNELFCYLKIAEDITADMRVDEYQKYEIEKISEELSKLALGNLDLHFEQAGEDDVYIQKVRANFDHIKKYIMQSVNSFSIYISDISEKLTAMANGDLDQKVTLDYDGNFRVVKDSLNDILTKFNNMVHEINSSTDQVSGASRSVSAGSQSLAQATAQQVAASQEIKMTVDLVLEKARENAFNTCKANKLVEDAKETSLLGAEKMKGMISAMTDINQASGNISKIIKTIEDIAFQTNILALNAAVEAARAGQYGKGFAVVASEVRNLASKSARAAQDTTSLIESTVKKTGKGVSIAGEAAEAFDNILETILEASELVNGISDAINEQALSIEQISRGAEHITSSAHTNSATAEESASASEEMYTQADSLKQMIERFKLRPRDNSVKAKDDLKDFRDALGADLSEFIKESSEEDDEEFSDNKFEFDEDDFDKF